MTSGVSTFSHILYSFGSQMLVCIYETVLASLQKTEKNKNHVEVFHKGKYSIRKALLFSFSFLLWQEQVI